MTRRKDRAFAPALLEVQNLSVGFVPDAPRPVPVPAIEDVSFSLDRGSTLCLVGESGCGKTVTAMAIAGLLPMPPARLAGGRILFENRDLTRFSEKDWGAVRGSRMGIVFQEPMTSLNPVMRVGEQITEGVRRHQGLSRQQAAERAVALLEAVGISQAASRAGDYPHQMSGGMRQRVMIAMAMAARPSLLIADEPTTALDVTIQRQILGLMKELVAEMDSALLLITHDLAVVSLMATDVAVMYAGRIVEEGTPEMVLSRPAHPYTRGLLRSRPEYASRATPGADARLEAIPGSVPPPGARPAGCAFHPRCPCAFERCSREVPPLLVTEPGHRSRCWLYV